jgi:Phospholipase_D-nuclease N-terminal
MLFFDGGLGLILFAVWVFCIIDVITTPEPAVRNLPKLVWLLIVILLVDVGSIAWLIAGRTWNGQTRDMPYRGSSGSRGPVTARPATRPGKGRATNPDDDEEFLASLRARAEEQRRRARDPRDEPPSPNPPVE